MKTKNTESPSILHDLGAVAGLYREVAWMLSQRVQKGPDWQQKLYDDAVRRDVVRGHGERKREPVFHR